jgi:hypothetical protein
MVTKFAKMNWKEYKEAAERKRLLDLGLIKRERYDQRAIQWSFVISPAMQKDIDGLADLGASLAKKDWVAYMAFSVFDLGEKPYIQGFVRTHTRCHVGFLINLFGWNAQFNVCRTATVVRSLLVENQGETVCSGMWRYSHSSDWKTQRH